MDKKTARIVKLLNTAFVNWQRDQIKAGVPASQASQTEFSRVIGVPNTSWSSWVLGTRIPTGDSSIKRLAACSYIGNDIYRALGRPVPVENKRLRFMVDNWDRIPNQKQDALLSMFEDSLPDNGDENLPSLA